MTIDLDKLEALARAAQNGIPAGALLPWPEERKGPEKASCAFIEAVNPAVVLQWIAETRVLVERIENFRIAMDCRNRQWNKDKATCLEVGAKGSYKCEQCELIEDDDRTTLAFAQVNK